MFKNANKIWQTVAYLSFIIVMHAYKQYHEYCIKWSDYGSSSGSNVAVSRRSIFVCTGNEVVVSYALRIKHAGKIGPYA